MGKLTAQVPQSSLSDLVAYLKAHGVQSVDTGIILGTGLGRVASILDGASVFSSEQLPYLPKATGFGHAGNLHYGRIGMRNVLVFEGRYHLYEGHSIREVVSPIQVLNAFGAGEVLLSNASGGLNPEFQEGDLMLVTDHINFMGESPIEGPNDDRLGPRFPDMIEPYHLKTGCFLKTAAEHEGYSLKEGVLCGVRGPQLETKAEYRMMRAWGCDAVSMSTIPEVIQSVYFGMKTAAISCITDLCYEGRFEPINVPKILDIAAEAEPKISSILRAYLRQELK